MESFETVYEEVKKKLSEKRFYHSVCVMERAIEYAEIYGVDKEKAKLAGIAHDILKETPKEQRIKEAEELGVLSQVTSVYQQILEILESKYHLSEEEATSIVEEASDAVYTRKLEAVVEGKTYIDESSNQMNQNDMLPEEEVLFQN